MLFSGCVFFRYMTMLFTWSFKKLWKMHQFRYKSCDRDTQTCQKCAASTQITNIKKTLTKPHGVYSTVGSTGTSAERLRKQALKPPPLLRLAQSLDMVAQVSNRRSSGHDFVFFFFHFHFQKAWKSWSLPNSPHSKWKTKAQRDEMHGAYPQISWE